MTADKLFYNGKIYTMEKEGETVEAVLVHDGKIVASGTSDSFSACDAAEKIDLHGKTVLPGFADTHMHLYMDCIDRTKINLSDTHSIPEIIEKLKAGVCSLKPGQWLFGENIHSDYLAENRFPNSHELDQVSDAIPIVLGSFCRHTHILNTKAMELCRMEERRSEVHADMLEYYEDGSLNGNIKEWAYDVLVLPHIPIRTLDENIELLDEYFSWVAANGITQLHAYQHDNRDGIRLYQELRRKKGLKCRITFNFFPDTMNESNIVTGFGDDYLKVGASKFLIDGSISSDSALMYDEYLDSPGEYGIMTYSQEELNELVKAAYDKGNDVAIHAIGDRGNDMVLTAIENAYKPEIGWNQRFYIIHATTLSTTFIERAKKLPVLLCTQPIFIRNFIGMAYEKIGPERNKRFMAIKTMLDNGLIVSAGSDAPVRELNPFHGIYCAVNRTDINGTEEISVGQGISVFEAISMYTRYAAYCAREEELKGTLIPGKVADMIVVDRNPFTCPHERLHEIQVEKTFLGGKLVFG